MDERVIRIAIDSAPAEAGARRVVRSLEAIARKSRETTAEIGKVESGLLRLRQAAGAMERARLEALGNVRRLGQARTGAAPAGGFQTANFIPGSVGVANGFGGHMRKNPALHQAAAVAAGPVAKVLGELFLAILAELIAEEVGKQVRERLGAGAGESGPGQAGPSVEQLAQLSEELEKAQEEIRNFVGAIISENLRDKTRRKEADLLAQIEAIEEERAAAREKAFFGPAVQPLERDALVVKLLQESLPDIRDSLNEILRLIQALSDKVFSERPAAPTKGINGAIGTSGLLQPAALTSPGGLVRQDGVAGPFGADGAGRLNVRNLALEESISLFSRLEPEIEAAAIAQDALNQGLQEGLRNSRALADGAKLAFEDYADAATNAGAQIEQAIGGALGGLENTLVGFVQSGKLEWKSLVDSMIADLIRLFIRAQILGPLAQALGAAFGGGSLGPQFTGTGFEGLQAAGSFQHGGAFTVGGSGGPDSRLVALRATPGERVTVTPRGAPASGAVVNVTVINQAGAEVETREQPNAQGGLDLLVLVRRDVEQDILGGGRIGRAIGQTFGASVRPVGR
jgi:hypothetical protein